MSTPVRPSLGHTHVTRNIMPPGICPACDEYHEKQSAKWFEEHGRDNIPELEFDTPLCPICLQHTDCEDGEVFDCSMCGVTWHGTRPGEVMPDHPLHEGVTDAST